MPQTATETKPTTDELYEAFKEQKRLRDDAADRLAYDVTFRADDPYGGQHQRPSAELTAHLKAEYRATPLATEAAFKAWETRRRAEVQA